jgi:hypothetical protein
MRGEEMMRASVEERIIEKERETGRKVLRGM